MLNKKGFLTPLAMLLALGVGAYTTVILNQLSYIAEQNIDMMVQDKFLSAITLMSDSRKMEIETNKLIPGTIDTTENIKLKPSPESSLTKLINGVVFPSMAPTNDAIILSTSSRLVIPKITTDSSILKDYETIVLSTNSTKECKLFIAAFNNYHDIEYVAGNSAHFAVAGTFPTAKPYPDATTSNEAKNYIELCNKATYPDGKTKPAKISKLWIKLWL